MSTNTMLWQRELWLSDAVGELRPYMEGKGLTVPDQVVVEYGATTFCDNGLRALGQCMPSHQYDDGITRIMINDDLSDGVRILDVLLHELIHATDDCVSDHGEWFQSWASAFGLLGNPATVASPRLKVDMIKMARRLGNYPSAEKHFLVNDSGYLVA